MVLLRYTFQIRIVVIVIALFTILDFVYARDDWEYWSQYEVKVRINDKFSLNLKPEIRFKDDFNKHYYTHLDTGISWEILNFLDLAPYYRMIYEKSSTGDWDIEHRFHLNATLKCNIFNLRLSDRNRIEHRWLEDGERRLRYRNKLKIEFPIRVTKLKISPFVSNEIFYDFKKDKLNKNRAQVGFSFQLIKNVKLGIFYLRESSKGEKDWSGKNVFGSNLKVKF